MLTRFPVHLVTSEPVELSGRARERIEAEIERHLSAANALISLLDRADGDPDLCASEHDGREPDEDIEPSLGWTVDGVWAGHNDIEIGHQPVETE